MDIPERDSSTDSESETLNSKRSEPKEWALLGCIFDRLCLFVFTIIDIIAFVTLLRFRSFSTIPHPKTFPREESGWHI